MTQTDDDQTAGTRTAAAQPKEARTKPLVGSLVHGLSIIMAFDKSDPEMTLTQVAEKTGMDRAGARRYLLTLASLGFVSQTGRLFRLTPKVMDLGYAYLSSMPLADKAQFYLDRIRDRTGFPMALGVLDGDHIVHVASANTDDLLSPALTIGRRFPLGYSSAGRSILANLDEPAREALLAEVRLVAATETALTSIADLRNELARIRQQGHALVDQEMAVGVRSLAVPILGAKGEVVASFNTYTFTSIVSLERLLDEALPEMKEAAAEIGRTLT
nr:IclR family transcriptional regulator C-terminal domain-containing protein [Oceanicola sp. S124]